MSDTRKKQKAHEEMPNLKKELEEEMFCSFCGAEVKWCMCDDEYYEAVEADKWAARVDARTE